MPSFTILNHFRPFEKSFFPNSAPALAAVFSGFVRKQSPPRTPFHSFLQSVLVTGVAVLAQIQPPSAVNTGI